MSLSRSLAVNGPYRNQVAHRRHQGFGTFRGFLRSDAVQGFHCTTGFLQRFSYFFLLTKRKLA